MLPLELVDPLVGQEEVHRDAGVVFLVEDHLDVAAVVPDNRGNQRRGPHMEAEVWRNRHHHGADDRIALQHVLADPARDHQELVAVVA